MGVFAGQKREGAIVSVNTGYSLTRDDHLRVIDVTATGSPVAVTVPAAGVLPEGFYCVVRRNPSSNDNVTLQSGVTRTLSESGEAVVLEAGVSIWIDYPTRGADGADGAAGADGDDGTDGADGKTWYSGSGAPSDGTGVNGDFYLDGTAKAYYGPKASGTWSGSGPVSLVGADGAAGAPGPNEVTTATDTDLTGTLRGNGSHVSATKDNLSASVAPGASDDNTAGYSVGSQWIDTTADKVYVCVDASTGAAVWSSGGIGNHAHNTTDGTSKLSQANTHESADTDTATTALHHTLGSGANQAAPGTHTHTLPSHYHSGGDIDSGTVSASYLPVGTGATDVAAGNHTHTTPKLDDLSAPDDNTDLNATTSAHGLILKATAPASGVRNVVCIDNAETAYKNAALFDSTNPADLGTAAPGTSLIAARRDHVHNTPAGGSGVATGNIVMTAKSTADTGFLLCDGSAVSRSTYADLFSVIGSTYGGGDGTATFNVPDFRGRSPMGVGTGAGGGASGTGLPSGGSALTAVARGTWKGAETHIVSIAEMPSHQHNINYGWTPSGGGTYGITINTYNQGSSNYVQAAGSGSAHNNLAPVMGVNFQIKT